MIKAIFFDINGTLIDIHTDESREEIYRTTANLLRFHGIDTTPEAFRERFWALNKAQRKNSPERHPEFDVLEIFRTIVAEGLSAPMRTDRQKQLAAMLAETFRAASMLKLELYPGVRETIELLRSEYILAAVSDAQRVWAIPELAAVGLGGVFSPLVISSDLGVRKPDERIYRTALDELGVRPEEVIFVGNDMFRDVSGPHKLGMKTVFFRSNQGEQSTRDAEPDYIIYRFEQLLEAVEFLRRRQ